MTSSRILIVDGHPDGTGRHFVHALAEAYQDGARRSGHSVRMLRVGELDFPLLRSNEDFRSGRPPLVIRSAQKSLVWASHIVLIYPLWLGDVPAQLKGFLEQTLRPDFAFAAGGRAGWPRRLLKGRSARIVVTMGMPDLFYRWYFRAHSLKSLERNIFHFCGIGPVRSTTIGRIDALSAEERGRELDRIRKLAAAAK